MKTRQVLLQLRAVGVVAAVFLLMAALSATSVKGADFPLRWRWSNPAPHGGNIFDMTTAFGLTVEVAERGQIYTSEDLVYWEPRQSNTTNSLRAAIFFKDRLIISGERGTIVHSDSLADFKVLNLGTSDWLESLAASSELVVAVGDNAAIYTSQNGTNWQRQSAGFDDWLHAVAYGAGTFVAVGDSGRIATSPDGINWTTRSSRTARVLRKVAWINNRFWVVGDDGVALSSNGGASTWTTESIGATNDLYSVTGNSDTRLAVGDFAVRLQSDSVWSEQTSGTNAYRAPGWTYYNALWDGSLYFISGRSGKMVEGFQTNATSPYFWIDRFQPVRNWLWEVMRTPDFYVTVGYPGTIMTSGNGINWQLELPPASVTDSVLLGVGGTTNLLIAVGEKGSIIVSPNVVTNVVFTNANGTTITNQASTMGVLWYDLPSRPTTVDLQGVTMYGNQFVVTGDGGKVLISADGTNWTSRTTPTTSFLSGVAAWPNGLVVVGKGGKVLTSSDTVFWTARSVNTTNWIYRVRYFDGTFIAVGQNGTILTSTNATNWTARTSGTKSWLNDVVKLENTYYVVGTQGAVLTSTNAVNWKYIGTITEKSLYGAAIHKGQLVTVGVEGAILRSQVIPDLTPVEFLNFGHADSQNVYLVAGKPDQVFRLDHSSTLTNWDSGATFEFLDSTGVLLILETLGSNTPPREFYRGLLTP